ncbi:glutamine--fructose-6-phosphate transaminase (isomerizing) [Candidatus Pacearchaeota archaeon]|nr:glutamine--fructose-6-phosphate transaminase (isomerizing) [Candidatus Pacearchaeota archaeon]
MCGIFGYIGEKEAASILVKGLKRLEYRGYDSAGICVLNKNEVFLIKGKGSINDIYHPENFQDIKGTIGIAHTRWATHGAPNEVNAHPHADCKKEIIIIHNGIIENYSALRKILEKEDHKFLSETDSEIFAHLIEKFYSGNLEGAVSKALKLIEGTFGLVVIHKNNEEIVVAKRSSPLILGIGENEIFIASDAAPIMDYTNKVIYLEDDDIATIKKSSYSIKNLKEEEITRDVHEIKWNIDQIEKKGFKHFMLKEIFEQPEALENVLRGRIKEDLVKLTVDFDINKLNRVVITACGTSWHSALIGKHLIEKISKIPVEVDYASEFRYRNSLVNENDLMIVVSQSGETADTLAALKEAKSKNVKVLGIVNVVGSTISRMVDSGIYLHAGPEIGVASTKAFTSQVMALLLFALFIRQKKGLSLDKNLLEEISSLPKKLIEVLNKSEEIKEIAEIFKSSTNFLYLGRGINFPVALEGALKLKEISYIHAEGYPAAEMKHGPIALIDENMPVVFLATNGTVFEKVLSNIEEVRARGGRIITITDRDDSNIKRLSDYIIKVPATMEELSPIINSIPLQLLAYHIADLKGLDVDRPRNLAKSVTVE